MRRLLLLLPLVAAFALAALPLPADEPAAAAPPDPLVVHEWGTFTSMAGTDGLGLEGLEHEEEALPEFVYSRSEVRACPLRSVGWKGLEVPANHVTHKMETPVIYVHSRTPRSLRVRVDLVGGLISQWYPVTDLLGPPETPREAGPLDLRTVERSFLEWDVDVIPRTQEAPKEIPAVAASDPWAFAREVDAAWLRTRPRIGPAREGPVEAEHYLFYRGLGRLALPFEGAEVNRALSFTNGSAAPVAQAIALEVGPEGREARYTITCDIQPGATVLLNAAQKRAFAPIESVLPGLESDMQKILRGRGLEADEALAMVRTWSRSWFRSEGSRVIYTVPREETDRVLPLKITPAPDHVVRVLIGRLEIVTADVKAEVEQALLRAAGSDAAAAQAGEARLARLGRFFEAHLEHVAARGSTSEVRQVAAARLAALKASEAAAAARR